MRDLEGGPTGETTLPYNGETIPAETANNSSGSSSRKSRKKERKPRNDEKRPKKSNQYFGSASNTITNRIQLSMLSTGLIHITDEEKAIESMCTRPRPSFDHPRVCNEHRKHPILFKVEFQMATSVEAHTTRHADKEENDLKNQNKRTVPYDYNRVVLEPLPDIPDSDYINASYVDSLLTPKAYIVAQGPREETIADFWRMVWQEKTRLIIMLTKTFDFIKVMCMQYWPASVGLSDKYEDITVELKSEEQLANFQIRTMILSKEGEPSRELHQFHYTEWPSHTHPFINALLEYRRRIRIWMRYNMKPSDGPVIVHCNDGGGRSGVFCAVDANLELHEEDGLFDIYGYLKKMRQARRGLIDTLEQYKFVYDTLEEFLLCGYTFFPVCELSARLKEKSMKGTSNKSEYQLEFEEHHSINYYNF